MTSVTMRMWSYRDDDGMRVRMWLAESCAVGHRVRMVGGAGWHGLVCGPGNDEMNVLI